MSPRPPHPNRPDCALEYLGFTAKVNSIMRTVGHPTEEGQGEQTSLAFKETCTKWPCCVQSCFWQGKKRVVRILHYN